MSSFNEAPPTIGSIIEMTPKCEFYGPNYKPTLFKVRTVENGFMALSGGPYGGLEEFFLYRWTQGEFVYYQEYIDEWAEELIIEV